MDILSFVEIINILNLRTPLMYGRQVLVVELMLVIPHELTILLVIKRAICIQVYMNLNLVAIIYRRWEFN